MAFVPTSEMEIKAKLYELGEELKALEEDQIKYSVSIIGTWQFASNFFDENTKSSVKKETLKSYHNQFYNVKKCIVG